MMIDEILHFLPLVSWLIWMVYCIIHWTIPSIVKKEKHEVAMSVAITLFLTTLLLSAYIEPLVPEVYFLQIIGQLVMNFALFIYIYQFIVMLKRGRGEKDWEDTTVLIKSGFFKIMRHPMFFACIMCNIATYFSKITWLSLFLPPISIFLCVLSSSWDEKLNLKKFGEEYENYMKKVKRFGIF
ncbi:MAG: methyltransferase family protein [Promethearchaeota archaeon]